MNVNATLDTTLNLFTTILNYMTNKRPEVKDELAMFFFSSQMIEAFNKKYFKIMKNKYSVYFLNIFIINID